MGKRLWSDWSLRQEIFDRGTASSTEDVMRWVLAVMEHRAISCFTCEGLDQLGIELRHLERRLYQDAHVAVYDVPGLGPTAVPVWWTKVNAFGEPTTVSIRTPDSNVVRGLRPGVDCVLIHDTQRPGYGTIDYLAPWAYRYADIQVAIDMQVVNQRVPVTITSDDPAEVRHYLKAAEAVFGGARILVLPAGLGKALDTLDLGSELKAEGLVQLQREYWARMCDPIGIDSQQAYGKKERLVVDEQESNDDGVSLSIQDRLNARRESEKQFRDIFSVDVHWDVITPTRIVSETDTGDGEGETVE